MFFFVFQVMKPLAIALDILQGQNYMYLGYLVPTIKTIMSKINKYRETVVHTEPLAEAIVLGINKRYLLLTF